MIEKITDIELEDVSLADSEQPQTLSEDMLITTTASWQETLGLKGDLGKTSRNRNIPIGENIRDAIRSIKGK